MKRVLLCVLLLVAALAISRPALASTETVHVVQPGQTLTGIARWYGVDMWALARANGIVNPSFIYVGQRLVIPATGSYMPGRGYIVRAGDTLYSIASRHGVTVWALAQANGIYNLNRIYVGQYLVIPGAAPAPPPKPAPTVAPTPKPVSGWLGEYYVGTNPTGGATVVRTDASINFHWGYGGPDSRVGADNFSAHWTRTFSFIGGLYRFKARSDDGVRVWVDQNLVLDAWRVQPETEYWVDFAVAPGSHVVTVDYFETSGVATIQFSFSRLGATPVMTPVPAPTATPAPPSVTSAWYGEYFSNRNLSGSPAATRWDGAIGFEWGGGAPIGGVGADNFSVRWTRRADFFSDNYAFCAMSDDGVRLYLDGVRVLDEWHPSNSVAYCGEANVTAGVHEVRAEYYEDGGNALIYVWWERR
ncbi:MAG: LysM peptidoglycan-binding domain-containing protein [Anaerolineae bacterium]|nr:LysM peptidoglycan-binding domain-containing protein [Anaerolineae bacterium]